LLPSSTATFTEQLWQSGNLYSGGMDIDHGSINDSGFVFR